jgi:hypothetical protein
VGTGKVKGKAIPVTGRCAVGTGKVKGKAIPVTGREAVATGKVKGKAIPVTGREAMANGAWLYRMSHEEVQKIEVYYYDTK